MHPVQDQASFLSGVFVLVMLVTRLGREPHTQFLFASTQPVKQGLRLGFYRCAELSVSRSSETYSRSPASTTQPPGMKAGTPDVCHAD